MLKSCMSRPICEHSEVNSSLSFARVSIFLFGNINSGSVFLAGTNAAMMLNVMTGSILKIEFLGISTRVG